MHAAVEAFNLTLNRSITFNCHGSIIYLELIVKYQLLSLKCVIRSIASSLLYINKTSSIRLFLEVETHILRLTTSELWSAVIICSSPP